MLCYVYFTIIKKENYNLSMITVGTELGKKSSTSWVIFAMEQDLHVLKASSQRLLINYKGEIQ